MPERPPFIEQLKAKWDEGKFVCVGLDADYEKIPQHIVAKSRETLYSREQIEVFSRVTFLKEIVNATGDLVSAFKPNSAFFEDSPEGEEALAEIIEHIHLRFPGVPVIGDVKRADIGDSNRGYAKMAFERYEFDAVTTNPYFGHDTYEPFLKYPGRGLLILCKTTNRDAGMYQDAPVNLPDYQETEKLNGIPLSDEEYELARQVAKRDIVLPLYYLVALRTATLAKENPNIGLVVGATHPEAFAPVRKLAPDLPFLIPGIGKQGGDLEKTLKYAPDSKGQGVIINSGSAIIYASSGEDFAEAARAATLKLHNQITELRAKNG